MFGTTVGVLRQRMRRWPDKQFIVGPGESLGYRAFYHRVNRLANFLWRHGVRRGDNVGLLMYNCPELYAGILAVHRLGAVANLWNFRLTGRDIAYLAHQVGAKAALCNREFLPALSGVPGMLILADAEAGEIPQGVHPFTEIDAMPETEPAVDDPQEMDVSTVIYTSGTTGRPKGAAYTHQTQLLSAIQYCLEMGLDLGRRGLTAAPVIHGGATNFFFAYLFIGGTFIDSGKYSPQRILQLATDHAATELMAVPTQIMELLRVAEEQNMPAERLSQLRLIRTAGSPYPKSMVERVHRTFGCHVLNTFGMTENCANVTAMHSGYDPEDAWTTIGKESYFWEARVTEISENAAASSAGPIEAPGRGQLIVRGPQNAPGYYMSEATPLYRDGWLFARDVVDLSPIGYMQIVDRVDETILTGGEIVYPQEVEMFLRQHPEIEDAAAIGVPDAHWGEIVMALIVRGGDLDEREVERYCLESEGLARYKRPRRIAFVDELPKNVFGKLERYKLRARYGAPAE